MKKIIIILIIVLLALVTISFVSAQDRQAQTGSVSRGIETATQNLTRVVDRNNNPEIGEQVRSMVQSHEEVQSRTNTALKEMSQRNQAVKLLIGPDYENAGQVRNDVVGLRNDIKKLEQIKAKSLPADVGDIQKAVNDLQVEADGLEVQLSEQLSGFSLFGWLARLFAN